MVHSNNFLFSQGIKELSYNLSGNETIHVGIRPFGFHAGNKLSLIAYPWLLAEHMYSLGIEPKFKLIVSINDWEPYSLRYLDPKDHTNIFPQATSFQYTPDPFGCCRSIVDHWEPLIQKGMESLSQNFPKLTIEFHRNSSLKKFTLFFSFLKGTLHQAHIIRNTIEQANKDSIKCSKNQYAGAICPICKSAQGQTKYFIDDNMTQFKCQNCSAFSENSLNSFDYWWNHIPMFTPRLTIFNVDLCILGGDHLIQNTITIKDLLLTKLVPNFNVPMNLVTPILLSYDGMKMSKSMNNMIDIDIEQVLNLARDHNQETIIL